MAALRSLLILAAFAASAQATVAEARLDDALLTLEPVLTGGFEVILTKDDDRKVIAHIGRTLVQPYTIEQIKEGAGVQVVFRNANLTVETYSDKDKNGYGVKIAWDAPGQTRLEDCIDFGTNQWYGGPMQVQQEYPIQHAPRSYAAYVSTEMDNGAIVERYWLNSAGVYVYVHPEVPLFVDNGNLLQNHLCFGAQIAEPYSNKREHTTLSYDIWLLPDAKAAHKHAVENYLGKPSDVPDFRMVQHPIWSTWAQYSRDINGSKLLDFAEEIKMHGFNNSQFEVDDLWETCYGSLTVDSNKFPNFTHFVDELKNMGYRVTLWIHPFINKGCDPVYTEALTKGYLVLNEEGSPDVDWWNNNGTVGAYVDFTNAEAAEWWYQRVKAIQDTHGIDSFKFDAGETSFSPQVSVQNGDIDLQPHHIVESYVKTCARFGDMVEVRAGFGTQQLPIFVRMVDRDSIWGMNNGLPTIITTTFQMNLNGYTMVLPDMIGGNGFNLDHAQADLPTKELFIRWVQANTFLPAMQFSFAPWNFDDEVSVQNGDIDLQPHHIVESYVKTCARFGDMVEVRAGFGTQQLPIFVRMVDRDSIWGMNNGLPTIITTTFQMNLNGYTMVLPDMIGGNGFNLDHAQADLPTKELFIRWVQANTFLPAMQFSFAPWNFDDETVKISRKYADLHAEYADKIYEAMQASVDKGAPVNGPLWWLDPTDVEAQIINDEYLLGEDIIVAPVLKEGATSRDVYLPVGTWLEEGDLSRRHEGPVWLHSVPAPLDVLLYYVREPDSTPGSGNTLPLTMVLIFAGILINTVWYF